MTENQMYCSGEEFPEILPIGVGVCEVCFDAFMNADLEEFNGTTFCVGCIPECATPNCTNKQHEQGEELCAKCALEAWRDEQKTHNLSQPVPMTEEWQLQGYKIELQCKLWEARQ